MIRYGKGKSVLSAAMASVCEGEGTYLAMARRELSKEKHGHVCACVCVCSLADLQREAQQNCIHFTSHDREQGEKRFFL